MNVFVNKKIILVPFLLACLGGEITYSYTFDNAMLESFGIENVDLSMFSGVSDQFSGEYLAQIEVNNNPLAYSHSVYFYHQNDESFLCVTAELVDLLPLKKSVANKILETSVYTTEMGDCYDLQSLDSAISITFDAGDQMLHLEMPQLYLENFDPSWVMPKMRDYGIAGLIFDYSLINAHSRMKHRDGIETRNTLRSYGNVGLNIDRFRFRANYQYDSKAQINKFDWNQIYAFTDIASLNAKLYAGEILSRTNVFDSVRLKGVTLFSDESMMPSYLQGYAPQITGVVSSNAIVTIKQYGAVIRSEQVSSGPFAISNLPSYINGTVDVEIEEEGSPRYTYQVDVSQVPFLTRKGHARYNANIGKLDTQYRHGLDTNLLSADLSYGLTNSLSLFGGIMGTSNKDYHALNMGVGLNLAALGALSFDVTHSRNQSDRSKVKKGQSYRVNYAKRFASSTTLNLAGYRFSSRNFTSLNNYIDMESGGYQKPSFERNRFTLSLTQAFPSISASVTASATKRTYWGQKGTSNYAVTFGKVIKKGLLTNSSLQFSLSKNREKNGYQSNRVGISINIPLNNYESHVSYAINYNDQNQSVGQQATYYTTLGEANVSVGVDTYHNRGFNDINYNVNAAYGLNTGYGQLTTTASYSDNYRHATIGFDGSITATRHGILVHPRVYEDGSRLIVDTEVAGVQIKSAASQSNFFGLAGVSNIPNYYRTTYVVDNDNLPQDVEIQDSIIPIAVADGTIAYQSVAAISGEKAVSTIRLPDGSFPPFGAVVYRDNGGLQEIAMIAERGMTYLSGLNQSARFIVKWSDQQCLLRIETLDLEALSNLICYTE